MGKAANYPPLKELLDSGDLEISEKDREKGSTAGEGSSGGGGNQNPGPSSNIRRSGDR